MGQAWSKEKGHGERMLPPHTRRDDVEHVRNRAPRHVAHIGVNVRDEIGQAKKIGFDSKLTHAGGVGGQGRGRSKVVEDVPKVRRITVDEEDVALGRRSDQSGEKSIGVSFERCGRRLESCTAHVEDDPHFF